MIKIIVIVILVQNKIDVCIVISNGNYIIQHFKTKIKHHLI